MATNGDEVAALQPETSPTPEEEPATMTESAPESPPKVAKEKSDGAPSLTPRSSDRPKKQPERFKEEEPKGTPKKRRKSTEGKKSSKKTDSEKKKGKKAEGKTEGKTEGKSEDGKKEKEAKKPKAKKSKQESNDDPDKLYCCNEKYSDTKAYIGCSNEKNCKSFEWYHLECVGLTQAQAAKMGDWFCNVCKKAEAQTVAHVCSNSKIFVEILRTTGKCLNAQWTPLNLEGNRSA